MVSDEAIEIHKFLFNLLESEYYLDLQTMIKWPVNMAQTRTKRNIVWLPIICVRLGLGDEWINKHAWKVQFFGGRTLLTLEERATVPRIGNA